MASTSCTRLRSISRTSPSARSIALVCRCIWRVSRSTINSTTRCSGSFSMSNRIQPRAIIPRRRSLPIWASSTPTSRGAEWPVLRPVQAGANTDLPFRDARPVRGQSCGPTSRWPAMECRRLTLSWFIAHQCGYLICPSLAGFARPMTPRLAICWFLEDSRLRYSVGRSRNLFTSMLRRWRDFCVVAGATLSRGCSPKSFSILAFTASSILMSGGQSSVD